jgi:hypothetical protein
MYAADVDRTLFDVADFGHCYSASLIFFVLFIALFFFRIFVIMSSSHNPLSFPFVS